MNPKPIKPVSGKNTINSRWEISSVIDSAVYGGLDIAPATEDILNLLLQIALGAVGEDSKQISGKSMDDFKWPRAKIENQLRAEIRKNLIKAFMGD